MPLLSVQMVYPHRKGLAFAVLLVYLASIISGGLHHHDAAGDGNAPAANSAPSSLKECQTQVNSRPAESGEESDHCTICIALQQAKAPSEVISLSVAFVPVGETVIIPFDSPNVLVPLVQQARAPPVI